MVVNDSNIDGKLSIRHVIIVWINVVTIFKIPCIISWFEAIFIISCIIPFNIISILGNKFLNAISTESINSLNNLSKSALSSAIPVNKFCHDAFIELTEPCIVSLASLAVVPIIPICFWVTEIAFTIFAKLIEFASTVTPNSFCTSFNCDASFIRRCISVLVPP